MGAEAEDIGAEAFGLLNDRLGHLAVLNDLNLGLDAKQGRFWRDQRTQPSGAFPDQPGAPRVGAAMGSALRVAVGGAVERFQDMHEAYRAAAVAQQAVGMGYRLVGEVGEIRRGQHAAQIWRQVRCMGLPTGVWNYGHAHGRAVVQSA